MGRLNLPDVVIYPPNGSQVVLELDGHDNAMAIDFADEDDAILFFEFMKQVKIESDKQ